jgi:hypothetical protein
VGRSSASASFPGLDPVNPRNQRRLARRMAGRRFLSAGRFQTLRTYVLPSPRGVGIKVQNLAPPCHRSSCNPNIHALFTADAVAAKLQAVPYSPAN